MLPANPICTAAVLLATSTLACAQWAQKVPANSPTARVAAAMDFVPQNFGLLMFGGGAPLNSNQTWLYDGLTWTQLAPPNSPTARFGAELVYDYSRGVAVLYGGLATNISVPPPTSETWEWNGTTWTQMAPTTNAGARYRYGACYDSVRGRVVMYGGATSQQLIPPNSQTWEYQGTTWSLVATTGNPGPRDRPAMCFHTGLGKAVLFGGSDGSSLSNQTWLYDGVAGTWTQVVIPGAKPAARNAAKMVYDTTRNLCVLTGGQDSAGPLGDTWTFDGATWTQQPTTTQTVRDHMLAFLPLNNQVVKFGGFAAAPNVLSNQTWEIGTGIYGVGCAGTNGVPTLSASSAPLVGQSWTLNVGNLNPSINIGLLVAGFTQLPGVDLTNLLNMPGCALFASPDIFNNVFGAGGSATWTWPTVAGPIGAAFYGQLLSVDPSVNAFGFTISNALYATIGS